MNDGGRPRTARFVRIGVLGLALSAIACNSPSELSQVPEQPANSATSERDDAAAALEDESNSQVARVSEARRKAIGDEIERLWPDHAWAGSYISSGTDTNLELVLAPDSGYVLWWWGCSGSVTLSYGSVRAIDGRLVLEPEFIHDGSGLSRSYIPVRWGDRHYMVREEQAIDFCNHFNLGWERVAPDRGALACRRPDVQAALGTPVMPPPYDAYLLDSAVDAKIVTVLEQTAPASTGWFRMHVQFDAGSKQRVFRGMQLHVLAPRIDGVATVEAVTDEMSLAEIRGFTDGDRPVVGSALSTSWE